METKTAFHLKKSYEVISQKKKQLKYCSKCNRYTRTLTKWCGYCGKVLKIVSRHRLKKHCLFCHRSFYTKLSFQKVL